jgi:flagellar protein FliO/FliZ
MMLQPAQPAPTASTATVAPATTPGAHLSAMHVATRRDGSDAHGAAGAVGGTVFALFFVLALIFALAWLARRMPGVAGTQHAALRVVASLALGPRERVVVVDVGGTQLLLGVGAGGTRMLHALAAPLPSQERGGQLPFAQLLAQHFGSRKS